MMNKILIVEDDKDMSEIVKSVLTMSKYIVTDITVSYDETIKSIKKNRPEIILMDISLEGYKNGIEIAKILEKHKDINIIYTTAYNDDETINKAIKNNKNCVGYITKPFKSKELINCIKIAFERRKNINFNKDFQYIKKNYFFNKKNLQLFKNDKRINLSNKEKILLNKLVIKNGKTVNFINLEKNLWKNSKKAYLKQLIYKLRKKFNIDIIKYDNAKKGYFLDLKE